MMLIPVRNKFKYEPLTRLDSDTGRAYTVGGSSTRLPSVTTILSETKDRKELDAWAERVGQENADRIRNEAATVGTHMHSVVERLLLNRPLPTPRTWLAVKGYRMGYQLIEKFFPDVQEVWGAEVPVYYPERYAGTTDCVAVYKNQPSIIDFKQTNKMKQRSWIEDYFVQLSAYTAAHNELYGTQINQGVVLMVSQNGDVQEFVTCGREFEIYRDKWFRRVDEFYKKRGSE